VQETFTVKAYMDQEDQPVRRILQQLYYTVNKGYYNKSSWAVIKAFSNCFEPPFMQLFSLSGKHQHRRNVDSSAMPSNCDGTTSL
jgi:hypothetical protein